ncbi:MAG: hypothetical protein WC481_04300 [Candidatus Omnitrophota bacterium]
MQNRYFILLAAALLLSFSSTSCAGLIEDARKTQVKPQSKKLEFPSGSAVTLSYSGKVKSAKLSEPFEVQGVLWPKDTQLEFDEAGKLRWASFRETVKVEGVDWPGPCSIKFAQNGRIYRAYMLEDCTIQGKQYKDGEVLKVDSKGQVIKISDIHK